VQALREEALGMTARSARPETAHVTDEMVAAAWRACADEGISKPHVSWPVGHPAHGLNEAAMRRILNAALAAGPNLQPAAPAEPADERSAQIKAIRLTKVQDRSVRMIDTEGSYSANERGNYYHYRHQPGNFYVDYRTADVLVRHGLAERRFGRLYRTDLGNAYARAVKRPD
jgi:hypothetical protein